MVQNHRKYRHIISAKKTRQNTRLLFTFAVVLYTFHTFYEVWCRAREHRKLRHFSTAKKTRETLDFYTNYPLFCILDVFLTCCFMYFFNGKTYDFQPREKAGILHWTIEWILLTSQRLCNRIAFCMPKMHFSSRFTVADWRKNTTEKHDTFEA